MGNLVVFMFRLWIGCTVLQVSYGDELPPESEQTIRHAPAKDVSALRTRLARAILANSALSPIHAVAQSALDSGEREPCRRVLEARRSSP